MEASELLREAARRVEQGWCRGALQDAEGNVCSLGALKHADELHEPLLHPFFGARSPQYDAAAEALAGTFDEQYPEARPLEEDAENRIWQYNDLFVPDKYAVIAAMEKAANNLEA